MTNEEYILLHCEDDVRHLALKGVPEGVDRDFVLRQIEGRQLALRKLPAWVQTEGILYPPRLSMEQCSGESAARYKRQLVQRLLPDGRETMADLTGGFGVDFSCLAPLFAESYYVERQENLCRVAAHNMSLLGIRQARIECGDAETFLGKYANHYTLLYIDPSRRDEAGRKVFALHDCTPDVARLGETLLRMSDVTVVKLSPMLDVDDVLRKVPGVSEVHVVSVDGECKELLLVMCSESLSDEVQVFCANLGDRNDVFSARRTTYVPDVADSVGAYLYEPNASILKAGIQDALCSAYGAKKLHPFSHLFTSSDRVYSFPGRTFEVESVCDFGKKSLKALLSRLGKANLAVRNFPSTVAQLRKKWGLKEGGDDYLFATTLKDGSHALILCRKCQ